MWSNLPFDLLATIFSYLPPDSFVRAKAACRTWHAASAGVSFSPNHPPWLVAFPTRSRGDSCYAYNPNAKTWHVLSLDRVTSPTRPIATINGLVLVRVTSTTYLQLAISNPFTNQFATLPVLNVARTNPAVGLVANHSLLGYNQGRSEGFAPGYKIYVAGGMTGAASGGGAVYQPSIEMYDSAIGKWEIIGPMPVEFAVRLTVWTPNESVFSNGILYWMTSARAYSVMGFEIETNQWRELRVPMADRLEFAALVPRKGKLAMVGGVYGGDVCVWELGEDGWCVVEKVPMEMVNRLLGKSKANWASVKCAGVGDGSVCLYRDLASGIVVCREDLGEGKWEWLWVDGCCSVRGTYLHNVPIKGLLLHPNLVHNCSNF